MVKRIATATVAASLFASFAFGQMKYSRSRSPSPTPTPTPQPLIPAQRGTPPPRTTPLPSPMPTPQQKMMSSQVQPRQSPPPLQRTMPTAIQPKATPTPLQKVPYGQLQSQIPSQRTSSAPPTLPTPVQPRIPAQRTFAAPQPGTAPMQPRMVTTPAPTPAKPTPTPVPPPDVKAYLERQIASSKDQKFHMTVNGKDIALMPFHFWAARSTGFNTTSTHIDMRDDDGKIYDIDFATTGAQISGVRIHRINGESVR